jgi:hypothetical protein
MLQAEIISLTDLGEDIFKGVVAPSCVYVARKVSPKKDHKIQIVNLAQTANSTKAELLRDGAFLKIFIEQQSIKDNPDLEFANVIRKGNLPTHALGEFGEIECKDAGINYQRVNVGMQEKGKSDLAERLLYEGKQQKSRDKMFWKGSDIDRYWIAEATTRWCRPYYSDFIRTNEVVHLSAKIYAMTPKILLRQTADHIIAALDERGVWFGRSIIAIILQPGSRYDIRYFLGSLNSRYFRWLYDCLVQETGRVFAQVKLSKLKQLPIRTIDFNNAQDKAHHDRMVSLVEKMLALHKQLPAANTVHEREMVQRQIDATDRAIDRLVSELYGLTEEEIKIVEGT